MFADTCRACADVHTLRSSQVTVGHPPPHLHLRRFSFVHLPRQESPVVLTLARSMAITSNRHRLRVSLMVMRLLCHVYN